MAKASNGAGLLDGVSSGVRAAVEVYEPARGGARPGAGRPAGPAPLSDDPDQLDFGGELATPERGRGRPLGKRNRTTEDFLQWLHAQDAMPGVALGKIVAKGWRDLQAEVGCSRLQAVQLWLDVCKTLMPHAHPKLGVLELKGEVTDSSALHLLAAAQLSQALTGNAEGLTLEGLSDEDDVS